jgi:hypothetical protein
MTVWQINFEDRATDAWLGIVLINRDDDIDADNAPDVIAELVANKLAPRNEDQWWVHFRRLPPEANIPDAIKNRLITDAAETAPFGFAMQAKQGAN